MTLTKSELKNLKDLKTKKGREKQNQFLVEGVRVLEEALKFKFLPIKLYYVQADISDRGIELVDLFKKKGIEAVSLSTKAFQSISDTESSQGIGGVFRVPSTNLSKLYKPSYRRVLLCDQINDPGNLGTLMRSALAFDFRLLMVTENTVELFNPKVVRASSGAIFGLPAVNISYSELAQFKKWASAKVVAALSPKNRHTANEVMPSSSLDKNLNLIMAIGSEAEGLSKEVLDLADYQVSISQSSQVESLNAAVAGSILMHELYEKGE